MSGDPKQRGEGVGEQRCNGTVKVWSLGTLPLVSKSSTLLARKSKQGTSLEGRGQDVEGVGNKVVESQTQRTWFMRARLTHSWLPRLGVCRSGPERGTPWWRSNPRHRMTAAHK